MTMPKLIYDNPLVCEADIKGFNERGQWIVRLNMDGCAFPLPYLLN